MTPEPDGVCEECGSEHGFKRAGGRILCSDCNMQGLLDLRPSRYVASRPLPPGFFED